MLLCAHGLYPANLAEPRAAKPYRYFVRSLPSLQIRFAMPLQPHLTTIVLPAFARSLSADREGKGEVECGEPTGYKKASQSELVEDSCAEACPL